jgi:hypothetical protein
MISLVGAPRKSKAKRLVQGWLLMSPNSLPIHFGTPETGGEPILRYRATLNDHDVSIVTDLSSHLLCIYSPSLGTLMEVSA